MYVKFSDFRGQTSAGWGQALVQKRGQVSDGGIGKISWGTPPPPVLPREKNPGCRKKKISGNFQSITPP